MIFQEEDEPEREKKAEDLLKLVELQDRMDHYPGELSGGQQQLRNLIKPSCFDFSARMAPEENRASPYTNLSFRLHAAG